MSHAALKNDRHHTLLDVHGLSMQVCLLIIVVVLPIYSFKAYKKYTFSIYICTKYGWCPAAPDAASIEVWCS